MAPWVSGELHGLRCRKQPHTDGASKMPKYWFRCGFAALMVWCAFAIFNTASATTYYVRTDGGTPTQCTGLANAAYSGSGSGQSCAWHSPMDALPPAASNQPNK